MHFAPILASVKASEIETATNSPLPLVAIVLVRGIINFVAAKSGLT